jgi:hypothetical protein
VAPNLKPHHGRFQKNNYIGTVNKASAISSLADGDGALRGCRNRQKCQVPIMALTWLVRLINQFCPRPGYRDVDRPRASMLVQART